MSFSAEKYNVDTRFYIQVQIVKQDGKKINLREKYENLPDLNIFSLKVNFDLNTEFLYISVTSQ